MSDRGQQPLCYTCKVGDSARQTGVSQAMVPTSGTKQCKAPWDELAAHHGMMGSDSRQIKFP